MGREPKFTGAPKKRRVQPKAEVAPYVKPNKNDRIVFEVHGVDGQGNVVISHIVTKLRKHA
jgi:hypothetical protein